MNLILSLFRRIGAAGGNGLPFSPALATTQTGDCGAVSPNRLEPRHRIERRKVHATMNAMRAQLGLPPVRFGQ